MNLLEQLQDHVLCGDGAMGTLLLDQGLPIERCLEEICMSEPDRVRQIHADYIAAGARVIETNSFGANAVRLARFGFEERVQELNRAAAYLAKEWGLRQEQPAARTLTIQLTRFALDESNKALGSVYGTEVKLAYTLKDARGNLLASGATSGTAHRYGRAHSVDNCNEVLSDSLKEALANVLADQRLQRSLRADDRARRHGFRISVS